jgi:hypothetical protein
MAFGSRGKGATAERKIAEHCTSWWWPLENGVIFVRTPLSGGWGKPQHREGFQSGGDLMSTSKTFPFAIEVKRRENWAWRSLELGGRSPAWSWWRQSIKAAKEMKKVPLMLFRQNRRPWIVMLPHEYMKNDVRRLEIPCHHMWVPAELQKIDVGGVHPICYLWDELRMYPPECFIDKKETL